MSGGRRSDRWGRVTVQCFGRRWSLRDAPALDWILAYRSPDLSEVFPGLIRVGDAEAMWALWASRDDMERRCLNVARVALGRAAGREWHWAGNLIDEALQSWPYINGMLVRQGVRAHKTSLADWLDACYTLLRETYDKDGRAALDTRLRRMPRGVAGTFRPKMSSRSELMAFAAD
jgi:hypothetical protein